MKNYKILFFFTIISIFILTIFLIIKFYNDEILSFFLNIGNSNFFFLYLFLSILYFVSPLPITFIILLNGYLFNNIGFVYSIILTLFGSSVLYFFSFKITDYFNINLESILKKQKN